MNLKDFIPILFVLMPLIGFSQQSRIDSLEQILKNADESEQATILNRLSELSKKDSEKAIKYAEQALAIAEKTKNEVETIKALKNSGIAHGFGNQYDKALALLLQSLALAEKNKEWDLAADDALNIGTVYYVIISDYEKSLSYYLQALSYYEKTGNKKGIASAQSGLGIAYTHEKKYDLALETLLKSLSAYEALGEAKEVPKVHVNIGTAYKEMNDLNKATEFLNLAIKGFDQNGNTRGKAHALFVIGDIYRIQKEYDKAIVTLKQALTLNQASDHKNSITDCLIQLGVTYIDLKKFREAETNLIEAARISQEIKKTENLSIAYQYLSNISQQTNDFENAYRYLKLHKTLQDSIFNEKKSKQIAEMQTRFQTETQEREIVLLKQEKVLNEIYLIAAIAFIIFITALGILIINRQKLKIKAERELAEKEAQLMEERRTLFEAELKNRELAEEQLQIELEFKNKELASYTLNVIQKNEILEDIKRSIEEIRTVPEVQVKQKLTSLINMVNYSFHLEKDWENFKMHFEQVHKNFFKKLLESHPDLSANDLKLCALIKLNMDNRGIAALLNISQESAKVARHRLRKKLDLSADQTLIAFLAAHE
jgi:tetratricopeptide (TPR) repeat protein/DNA-binding CsgD family transcriptional regulator